MRTQDREAILRLPDDCGQPQNTAVVVASCSRFRQVWMPFFTLFRRYWPDCPYKVYLMTDLEHGQAPCGQSWFEDPLPADVGGVRFLSTPRDHGWCRNALLLLGELRPKRIIMFQEDFLLTAPADTEVVRRLARYADDNETGCLRLMPCPGPNRPWRDSFLGEIGRDMAYHVSFQLAIWSVEVLMDLVSANDNPWELERHGSEFTAAIKKPFLSVYRESDDAPGGPVPYFITAVRMGKWLDGALDLLRRENIPMDGITKRIP